MRLKLMLGREFAHSLEPSDFHKRVRELSYLRSKEFQDLVEKFMGCLEVSLNKWGGDEEMRKIANVLNINI